MLNLNFIYILIIKSFNNSRQLRSIKPIHALQNEQHETKPNDR